VHFLFRPENHLTPIRRWARACGARLNIDGETFALSVIHRRRAVELRPKFSIRTDTQQIAYVNTFPEVGAFVGWMSYQFKRWAAASDKLVFKELFSAHGLRVPRLLAAPPGEDFLIKSRTGSFGVQVKGPFCSASSAVADALAPGEFCEQYIVGRPAKVWYWNDQPVAIELVAQPYLMGDGRRTVAELLAQPRGSMDFEYKPDAAQPMLAWQQLDTDSLPAQGEKVWLGFKYATPYDRVDFADRDVWAKSSEKLRAQAGEAGKVAFQSIPREIRAATMFTLDAVVDADDHAWWLEMNSHAMVHPRVYAPMLSELFGQSVDPRTSVS